MREVYPLMRLTYLLMRESVRHVGAAATAASLRDLLDSEGLVKVADFDRSFAASRLTPGTNLIALFAALGLSVGGWIGAVLAVVVGLLPATLITVAVCAVYLAVGDTRIMLRVIEGASAAAWAVLIWSACRFLSPWLRVSGGRTLSLTGITIALAIAGMPIVAVLALAAVGGIVLLPKAS